ncbi:MAG: MFS transporter, partial [Actinomycetota bacterium]|nr:MFS transporter [Actinomycetota bacterium]
MAGSSGFDRGSEFSYDMAAGSVASGPAPPLTPTRTGPPSRLLVFSVTAMALLNNSVLMSSTPEILESFGEPVERAGMLIAAGTVTGIVAAPAIGFLADRYGRKRVLVPCLL